MLHATCLSSPLTALILHEAVAAATVEAQQVELFIVKTGLCLETGFYLIKGLAPCAEVFRKGFVLIVQTSLVIAWSVLEAKCYLLTFVFLPAALAVELQGCARAARVTVQSHGMGCSGMVHLQASQVYVTLIPSAIIVALCRGHILRT